jgi:hypothetical protein
MSAGDPSSFAEELERLARLRENGALSDDEFQKLKEKLLSVQLSSVTPADQSLSHSWIAPDEESAASRFKNYFSALLTAIILIGPFVFPLVMEGTGNECSALERSALRAVDASKPNASSGLGAVFVNALQRMSNGAFAQALATKKYPNLPPVLACTVAYYEIRFNGDIPSPSDTPNSASSTGDSTATDTTSPPPPAQSSSDISPDVSPSAPQEPTVGEQQTVPASNDAVVTSKGTDVAPTEATAAPVPNDTPATTAPPSPTAVEAANPKGHWYYCDPAKAYFPYVQRCPVPWRPVTPSSNSATPPSSSGDGAATGPPTSLGQGTTQ